MTKGMLSAAMLSAAVVLVATGIHDNTAWVSYAGCILIGIYIGINDN